jgi:NitT/TauT family transport system substrate-binding protein
MCVIRNPRFDQEEGKVVVRGRGFVAITRPTDADAINRTTNTKEPGKRICMPSISYKVALLLLIALLVPATTAVRAASKTIRFGLATVPPPVEGAGFAAIPLGMRYWEAEGLHVEIRDLPGSLAVYQALQAGQLDAAASSGSVVTAVANGLPLFQVYTHTTGNIFIPAVVDTSPITDIAGLVKGRVGVPSLESGTVPWLRAYAVSAGVDPDALKMVAIGTGAEAAEFLHSGRVDGILLWRGLNLKIQQALYPIKIREIDPGLYRKAGFIGGLYTTKSYLADNRQIMIGLARGIAKAYVFAFENPECAVKVAWATFPDSKPIGSDDAALLANAVAALKIQLEDSKPVNGLWGMATDEQITLHMQVLLDAGIIKQRIPISQYWTSDLLKEVNDFDPAPIKEQARACDLSNLLQP